MGNILKKRSLALLLAWVLWAPLLLAQSITVKGTVKDTDGLEVIGATILVEGHQELGASTNLDGQFILKNVPSNAVLQISYVGMKSQRVDLQRIVHPYDLTIILESDSELLEEVVVTALGMKRETKALGYAVTELKGDDLAQANTINPVSALQGKVAGVDIKGTDGGLFGGTKIQIRGASTLASNNQPIYIVDGVILNNDISGSDDLNWSPSANDYGNILKNLNPDDFESVSVLKGAAATALYGSRGLNGAIVITTKGGKARPGIGIQFSQTFGIDHVFDTPRMQTKYGRGMFPGLNKSDIAGNPFNPAQLINNSEGIPSLIQTTGLLWGPKVDYSKDVEYYDKSIRRWEANPQAYLGMFNTGLNSNTNISFQGGDAKSNFYTSLSYRTAAGTSPKNSFDRFSFFGKGQISPIDWLTISASFNWTRSTAANAPINFGEKFIKTQLDYTYDPKYLRDKYAGVHGGIANNDYGDKYGNVPGRDIWFNINHHSNVQRESVFRPTLDVEFKITDWLRLVLEGNMNYYTVRTENKALGSGYANDGGAYGIGHSEQNQSTYMATLFANKTFGDFQVGGFLRGESWRQENSATNVSTDGGLIVPGQYFIGNSKKTPKHSGGVNFTKKINSVVFAGNISYKDTYFIDVTGRNDWSSALVYADGTGNYSYFYPSVSGSWLISNSFDLPSWVTFAKLRASWAQVGNDTAPYFINTAYGLERIERADGFIYTNTVPTRLFDPSIRPERKNALEVGTDLRFFDNRIGVDLSYYKENTRDQIIEISTPWISGANRQLINAGDIQNSGVEIALNLVPIRNKDWEWTLDATYTRNENKIIRLHENVTNYIELQGQPNNYDYRVGSVAMIADKEKGISGDYGILMSDILPKTNEKGEKLLNWSKDHRAAYYQRSGTVQPIGNLNPDFLASLRTGLRWKGVTLNVALDGRFGGTVVSYANRYGTAYGVTETSLRYRDTENGGNAWISKYEDSKGIKYEDGYIPEGVFAPGVKATFVDGTEHDVAGLSYRQLVAEGKLEPTHAGAWHYFSNSWGKGTINDDWVHELNYIALREISLNYSFSREIAEKLYATGLNIGFSARNLGYLYNSLPNNLHPESVRGNRAGEFRIRAFQEYTANYMFSLNLSF